MNLSHQSEQEQVPLLITLRVGYAAGIVAHFNEEFVRHVDVFAFLTPVLQHFYGEPKAPAVFFCLV